MSAKKVPLFKLPICSTDFGLEAYWDGRGISPAIRSGFHSELETRTYGSISFDKIIAMRESTEICCTVWQIEDAYETLVEVENSTWLKEILNAVPPRLLPHVRGTPKHYMIYLDSSGCFEVLASSFQYAESDQLPKFLQGDRVVETRSTIGWSVKAANDADEIVGCTLANGSAAFLSCGFLPETLT